MEQAIDQGGQPLRTFLLKYAREKDIRLFVEITHAAAPRTPQDLTLQVLVPAYIISELQGFLSDWRRHISSVHGYRSGDRLRDAFHGDDAIAAHALVGTL
jgi:hypothetical protein